MTAGRDAGRSRGESAETALIRCFHSVVWLVYVRLEALVKEPDRESFVAASEIAVAYGWRYTVAARRRDRQQHLTARWHHRLHHLALANYAPGPREKHCSARFRSR
ncbi:hypothetical protein ACFY1P_34785 [Streptomyces sp. NPDC001407]|uniref:hypothetical protein n=1 Tax=Streptomyces sp. NPDC001407 TaxID=3364573 RepID=UPI00369F2594